MEKVDVGSVYQDNVNRFSKGLYTVIVHLLEGDKTATVLLQLHDKISRAKIFQGEDLFVLYCPVSRPTDGSFCRRQSVKYV